MKREVNRKPERLPFGMIALYALAVFLIMINLRGFLE